MSVDEGTDQSLIVPEKEAVARVCEFGENVHDESGRESPNCDE